MKVPFMGLSPHEGHLHQRASGRINGRTGGSTGERAPRRVRYHRARHVTRDFHIGNGDPQIRAAFWPLWINHPHPAGMTSELQLSDPLRATISSQSGIVTRSQLHVAGELSDQSIWWRIRSGRWQPVLPGVYATFTGKLTASQLTVAASLYGGPDAQIGGAQALRWHGFRYAPNDPQIHLLVPHTRRRRSYGFVVVERTHRLDCDPKRRGPVAFCGVARAVADVCRRSSSLQDARAVVAESVQRGKITVSALLDELGNGPVRGSALLRRCIAEIAGGVRSAPEAEARELLARSRILPAILWNPRLQAADGTVLPTPDGWVTTVGIALEIDSREYHTSPADWRRTLERHNILARHGVLVLHFTPAQLRTEPATVLDTVEHAYLERKAAGTLPSVTVTPPS
jgi:hypothetical protein